ncbi:MAG: lipid-A-disaccharide synthase [Crocinitomicaceae bacterium]|nr:lipid-A-disaccharide synthase [Crocinitomicaceae bacterium]|tara:strand:+ start:3707 stop:4840 length:1134 start_codon:yes stop_codon:yes gene_type:complete
MKYYIVSGEASGDLHASNLMKEILKKDPNAKFRCWGGDLMREAGGEVVKHYKDLNFMGFWEVIKNIRTIFNNLKFCKLDIVQNKPDVLILVDYPGFNMRIAKYISNFPIPVIYYISPQVWAWKEKRVEQIRKFVTKLFVILPFEKEFYKKHNIDVTYVGHPLIDAIEDFKTSKAVSKADFFKDNDLNDLPIITLLPGSRRQEIIKKLPIMVSSVNDKIDKFQIVIGGVQLQSDLYKELINDKRIKVVFNDTYNLLNHSHVALVTSGTATLETALFNVPQVVCYKSSWFSYQIAKMLVKNIKYISLVNLILNKNSVKELIQNELTSLNLSRELDNILSNINQNEIFEDYKVLIEKCGGKGASKLTANELLKTIGFNEI